MNKRLLLKSLDNLDMLKENNCYLFYRAQGFETIGIITKIKHVYDGSWGIMRRQAIGITLNGNKFDEYLDRKNKRTGSLEDLVQMQTDLIIVTARNSNNPDDDDNSNFTYLLDPHSANSMKDKLDQISEYKRIGRIMEKKAKEAVESEERLRNQLDVAQSESNSYRERMKNFAHQLGQARARAEYYQTQLKKEQAKLLEMEGYLSEQIKGASTRGEIQGKDSSDVVKDAAKKQFEAQSELDKLTHSNTVTKSDLDNFEQRMLNKFNESKKNNQVDVSSDVEPPEED
ncbi:MAG: hypothetical protein KGY67_00465 [Candidatus Thermoplasmatota archaeon]|nr:hypothetical protein [Candidatus Thermoplasmatota archaeon]